MTLFCKKQKITRAPVSILQFLAQFFSRKYYSQDIEDYLGTSLMKY